MRTPYREWPEEAKQRKRLRNTIAREKYAKKGLCPDCAKNVAIKIILQNGKEVHRERLGMCFEHLKKYNKRSQKSYHNRPEKGKCELCHSNPASLCGNCLLRK